jgi:hypothetical protein
MLLSLLAMAASLPLASCNLQIETDHHTNVSTLVLAKTFKLWSVVRSGGLRAVRSERPREAGLDIVGDGEYLVSLSSAVEKCLTVHLYTYAVFICGTCCCRAHGAGAPFASRILNL